MLNLPPPSTHPALGGTTARVMSRKDTGYGHEGTIPPQCKAHMGQPGNRTTSSPRQALFYSAARRLMDGCFELLENCALRHTSLSGTPAQQGPPANKGHTSQ